MKLRTIFCVMVAASVALVGCSESSTTNPPIDTTPPLAPVIVSATTSNGYLGVWWEPNIEPDLAGYNVYRVGGTKPARLNPFLLHGHAMAGVPVNHESVRVYVTAVDYSGNESAPSSIKQAQAWSDTEGGLSDNDGKRDRQGL